jgi:hypothetical protein
MAYGFVRRARCTAIQSTPAPVRRAALEAVLGRLGLPCRDPGVGRLRRREVADEAVAGGGSTGHVDGLSCNRRTQFGAREPPPFPWDT